MTPIRHGDMRDGVVVSTCMRDGHQFAMIGDAGHILDGLPRNANGAV